MTGISVWRRSLLHIRKLCTMSYTLHSYHGDIKYAYLINSFKKNIYIAVELGRFIFRRLMKRIKHKTFFTVTFIHRLIFPPKDQIGSALGCDQYTLMNSIL